MIVLFTDFGVAGPYIGQLQAVLLSRAPQVPIINLFADAPTYNPRAAAYLLSAYTDNFDPETVFLCVVDPGVGNQQRKPVVLSIDGRYFVGPHNGLFSPLIKHARTLQQWEITWRPPSCSTSFHGRDLFAPIAAWLARGVNINDKLCRLDEKLEGEWPDDLCEVIYIDYFGNAMTGLRGSRLSDDTQLFIKEQTFYHARTFSDVPEGQGFWYNNANGLAEIAVNKGRAVERYKLAIGDIISIIT